MATSSSPPQPLGNLHYGGSINQRTGRLGPKPSLKNQFKKLKRLELMVRLENAGIPEAASAAMLTISVPRLRYIKRSSDYLNARIKITHGIILDHDGNLELIKAQRREILTQQLPMALQVLANELMSQDQTLAARKHRTALALELMDREGTLAKISRTEVKPVDSFDFEKMDEQSRGVMAVIRGIAAPPAAGKGEHTVVAISANAEFSNSHTLSAMDQQKALDALEAAAAEGNEALAGELLEIMPPTTESVQ